ncbi:GAF domain-containing protein [Deinococcus detaillensis]|uniref:histidine kinase n=1 Tax=Deinococcus detaillensis TaxID=2592048 RepID=A0A553UWH3_9DEIO|nr:GAF domain-containing protein [Deinococcus detaillensis]TSA84539.1 GAF domain-containing protein [Deinococcus detaillensis]
MLAALAQLSQAQHASGFLRALTAIAAEQTKAHGAQARLGDSLSVICAEGRGLGLSDGSLARLALTTGAPQRSAMICALPLPCGSGAVLEVIGGAEAALLELETALPLLCLAFEGALAREARRGRGRVTETLAQLSTRIGGSLDLAEVLTATAHSAAHSLGFERALVGLFTEQDESGARAREVFTHGFDQSFSGDVGVGPESFERLMERGEVIVYDHERDHATPLSRGLAEFAPLLALIAPLKARGRALGILYADVRVRRPLSEGDDTLLLALAEQASLAIDNARRYADETRKRHVAESLREVGAALSHSLHLADTLGSVLSYARTLFGADACAVHELQPDGRTLSIRSAVGLSSEYVLRSRAKVGAGVTGRAIERGQLTFSRDVSAEKQGGGSRYTRQLLAAGKYPYRGVVGLALSARGHVFGGLTLYYKDPLPLDTEDLALTEVFAAQAALAIENARLYEDEVRREREGAVLLSVAARLQPPLARDALSEVARELTEALGAERGLLMTLDDAGRFHELATVNLPTIHLSAAVQSNTTVLSSTAVQFNTAVQSSAGIQSSSTAQLSTAELQDAADSEPLHWLASQLGKGPRPLTRRHLFDGASSGLLAPVQHQGSLLGFFYADHTREDPPSERHLHLARSLTDQVALSLSRERLLSALAREEARYRLLAHSAHDLILAADPAGRVTYANPASQRLLGPVEGRELWPLMSAPAFLTAWQLCLAEPESGGRCEIAVSGLERELRLEVRLSAVTGGGAAGVQGMLLVARDLSELQTLAAEIQRRGQELEAVSARQGELRQFLSLFTQAQEEERRRISRELHDDTAQVLVALGRRIDRLGRDLTGESRERAADIRADLNSAIESVRRFARNLRPSVLDDLGLLPALEWLVSQSRTPTRLEVQGAERRLSGFAELTVYRAVQEALGNVDKHAQASSAAVRVMFQAGEVDVSVSDDGRGLDRAEAERQTQAGHMGLLGLRERVALSGGELSVESSAGQGTQVRFALPG